MNEQQREPEEQAQTHDRPDGHSAAASHRKEICEKGDPEEHKEDRHPLPYIAQAQNADQ